MTLNTVKVLTGPAILGSIVLFKKKNNLKQTYNITKKPIYRNTINNTTNNINNTANNTANNTNNFKKTIPINRGNYPNNIIKQIIPINDSINTNHNLLILMK